LTGPKPLVTFDVRNTMKKTDSRPAFVRRQSCLLRIEELDAQLERTLAAKAEARAALAEIDRECGESVTIPAPAPALGGDPHVGQSAWLKSKEFAMAKGWPL
jgi:hypothetical protein